MNLNVVLFPGQGSQFCGMGSELFPHYPQLLQQADNILGFSVKELCLHDPNGDLSRTEFTQIALFVVNALAWQSHIDSGGFWPNAACGHSLGEYNALFAAGVFDFETGLNLIRYRGQLMGRQQGGGMAAVIGSNVEKIRKILDDFAFDTVDIANYNSPRQVVISGPKRDIDDLAAVFEEIPDTRYVVLNVSGAFHSRYMQEAAREFGEFIRTMNFRAPRFSVIANTSAQPYTLENVVENLTQQIASPVRWTETIAHLCDRGKCTFQELGVGNTLTRLLYQISPNLVPEKV
ncbi:hypothetical protein AMR42_04250 [Limnothrix sp. PR1529]|uniref:ACP S-malonyltransferase n=1 Tax=Limnothrix sp. PR1529 TaxID=1704291 RepID=UPI00081E728B|nr:ACP S-malonyltransferase [Limnothrix sp. PR1529]OCQ90349.1 malonyl CoA-acyl carrier protein transacylase [Limnothrix sp. P13C2]PIB14793.1 hypothetical protein AMR42_04250 [Limnothrix sp. PR1529]